MKKELKLSYDRQELTGLLDRLNTGPFFPVYCSEDGFWYLFRFPEPANAFKLEGEGGVWDFDKYCTPENIVMSFEGKSPREIELVFETTVYNIRYGTTGNKIKFSFATIDASQTVTKEGVYATYKFNKSGSSAVYAESYEFNLEANSTNVEYLIDNYIKEPGTYTVYITLVGKETGTRITKSITVNVREISIESDFDISQIINTSKTDFYVNYWVKGVGERFVTIQIDDGTPVQDTIAATETTYTRHSQRFITSRLGTGRHILQMYAYIIVNNVRYQSETLYYEFTIAPDVEPRIMIADTLSPNVIYSMQDTHTVKVEQFVGYPLKWAYYTNSVLNKDKTITVQWRAKKLDSDEYTSLSSLKATMYTASYDKKTDDLLIVAQEVGTFELQAWRIDDKGQIVGDLLGSWQLQVSENTTGIRETTTNLVCKYSALARYNSEDDATKSKWEWQSSNPIREMFVSEQAYQSGVFDATFSNVLWSPVSGWIDSSALRLANDARCTLNCKPFAFYPSQNGCTFEVEFSTDAVYDVNTPIITVGNLLTITPTKATLQGTSLNSTKISTNYVTSKDKRVKIAFIIHPSEGGDAYAGIVQIMVNGVLDRATRYTTDTFTDNNVITIGSSMACTYIYSLRVYPYAIDPRDEFNNTVVDSTDISTMVINNDIYDAGSNKIDVDKVKARIPCMCVTADLMDIINAQDKAQLIASEIQWTNPQEPETNFTAFNIPIRKHGQSTLNYPIPSFKFWLYKKDDATGSVLTTLKDSSNNVVTTGRWAMHQNNMPLRKYVLQAFYVDSSLSKSGALMNVINTAYHNVLIGGQKVLNTPPMNFIENTSQDGYAYKVAQANNIPQEQVTFPYELRHTPDSIPCCIFYRSTSNDSYVYLGQFVLMDDKKSDFLYGERSIRDCLNDPFTFYHSDSDYNRIWDNANTTRFELLDNVGDMLMFKDNTHFWDPTTEEPANSDDYEKNLIHWEWEKDFELIYPDPDDLTYQEYRDQANKLNSLLNWFKTCYTEYVDYGTFTRFNNEVEDHLNLWSFVAYYNICLDNGLFDSTIRNLQLITWDEDTIETPAKWYTMWWDLDIQDGTVNSGYLKYAPKIDFNTSLDGEYAFPGANNTSYLWMALRQNPEFQRRLPLIKNALFNYGYSCNNILKAQEEDYAFRYNECLYNGSQEFKYLSQYLNFNNDMYLAFLQGRGEMYRRYWLTTNMDYQDAKLCAGAYTSSSVNVRINKVDGPTGRGLTFTYGTDMYVGYGTSTNSIIDSLIEKHLNDTYTKVIDVSSLSDTHLFYGCSAVIEADFSELAPWIHQLQMAGNNSNGGFLDSQGNSLIQTLNIGVTKADMLNGYRNSSHEGVPVGLTSLISLEELNLQGYTKLSSTLDLSPLYNLKRVYLGGSTFGSVLFPDNIALSVELPSSLNTLIFNNNTLTDIKFVDNTTLEYIDIPNSISTIRFESMGKQVVTKNLITTWLHAIDDAATANDNEALWNNYTLTITDLDWTALSYEDLMLLAKIPKGQRQLTGYIQLVNNTQLTSLETSRITEAFGENCLNGKGELKISLSEGFIISVASGNYTIEDGQIVVQAGDSITLDVVKYPIREDDTLNLVWMYKDLSVLGTTQQIVNGSVTVGNNFTFNASTLSIVTTENSTADHSIQLTVTNFAGDGGTSASDNISIKVKKRSYPTQLSIISPNTISTYYSEQDSVYVDRLTNTTRYTYSPEYNQPAVFNGTIERINWELIPFIGQDSSTIANISQYLELEQPSDGSNSIILNYIEEPITELRLGLRGTIQSKGNVNPYSVRYLSLLKILQILKQANNYSLFYILQILGNSATLDQEGAYYYSTVNLADILSIDVTSTSDSFITTILPSLSTLYDNENVVNVRYYYIPDYLTRCTTLNLNGAIGLKEDVDVSQMRALQVLDLRNTGVTGVNFDFQQRVQELHLESPNKLLLPNLPISMQQIDYIKNVNSRKVAVSDLTFEDAYVPECSSEELEDYVLDYADTLDLRQDLLDFVDANPQLIPYINHWKYCILSLLNSGIKVFAKKVEYEGGFIETDETYSTTATYSLTFTAQNVYPVQTQYYFGITNSHLYAYTGDVATKVFWRKSSGSYAEIYKVDTSVITSEALLRRQQTPYPDADINITFTNNSGNMSVPAYNKTASWSNSSPTTTGGVNVLELFGHWGVECVYSRISEINISDNNVTHKLIPYFDGEYVGFLNTETLTFNKPASKTALVIDINTPKVPNETYTYLDTTYQNVYRKQETGIQNQNNTFSIQSCVDIENFDVNQSGNNFGLSKLLHKILTIKKGQRNLDKFSLQYILAIETWQEDEFGNRNDWDLTFTSTNSYQKTQGYFVCAINNVKAQYTDGFESDVDISVLGESELEAINNQSGIIKSRFTSAFEMLGIQQADWNYLTANVKEKFIINHQPIVTINNGTINSTSSEAYAILKIQSKYNIDDVTFVGIHTKHLDTDYRLIKLKNEGCTKILDCINTYPQITDYIVGNTIPYLYYVGDRSFGITFNTEVVPALDDEVSCKYKLCWGNISYYSTIFAKIINGSKYLTYEQNDSVPNLDIEAYNGEAYYRTIGRSTASYANYDGVVTFKNGKLQYKTKDSFGNPIEVNRGVENILDSSYYGGYYQIGLARPFYWTKIKDCNGQYKAFYIPLAQDAIIDIVSGTVYNVTGTTLGYGY